MVHMPKILVVDDSPTSSLFMVQALGKGGYHVITAANGREGWIKALQERPQCVLLDVVLPEISGFSLCRQLRSIDPHRTLAIIMVSSKITAMDRNWGLRQGADRYLPKPFTEEALLQVVGEVLAERYPVK